MQEELKDRNALLKLEYNNEKKHQAIQEQNRLYDLPGRTTQKQTDRISILIEKYEYAGKDTDTANTVLAEIALHKHVNSLFVYSI